MENLRTTCQESVDEIASIMDGDEDEEYIQSLLDRELPSGGILEQASERDRILQARFIAINYILRKREALGLRFLTAYLSVAYLDGYLSRKSIPDPAEQKWWFKLFSIACLSLAVKMEESRVRPLSDLRWGNFDFQTRHIRFAEVMVLNALGWKMGPVTPFAFISFFVKKLFPNSQRDGVFRIVNVILFSMRDERIMRHKPSVIGASATLVALVRGRLTRHELGLKISPLASRGVLEIEDFIACYNGIQDLRLARNQVP